MKILKLEPFSGLSGDMFLGLLADLGDAFDDLKQLPKWLKLEDELSIELSDVNKTGIACRHVKIIDAKTGQRKHDHHHRHLKDVNRIIDESLLDEPTKCRAKDIFADIAKAESEIHGVSIEKIHFHEVGAIDSIADVVGAAWLIEKLDIDATYCEIVNTGYGFVNTEHGRLPVPAPATQKLLLGMPTSKGEIKSEMVTPTGAAILRNLNPVFEIPSLVENKIGYGPGEKDFQIPNVLRGSLCSTSQRSLQLYVIECNMDDSAGEYLGRELQDLLLSNGAQDVYLQPVIMKKSRHAVVLKVITYQDKLGALSDLILTMSTSIGLRYYPVSRKVLKRSFVEIETQWGLVKVKEVTLPSGTKSAKPESDDVMKIAITHKLNPEYVKHNILASYEKQKL